MDSTSTKTLLKKTATNTGLAKVAVQCSADKFVVNQSLVLRINICGENRHLRQARKRYRSGKTTTPRKQRIEENNNNESDIRQC